MYKKLLTASELNKKLAKVQLGENSKTMDELVGKKICVLGAESKVGEFGDFFVMKYNLAGSKKVWETATGSAAITKLLENGEFPFEGKIVCLNSKKRKGQTYFAFE